MTAAKSPIQLHQLQVRFLLDDVDTDGKATVFETLVPAGAFVPPPHSHDSFEETVYVQRGTFSFTIDGTTREASAGDAVFIGRGQVHSFDNAGDEDGAFLSVATPGVFLPAYFLEIAAVLATSPDGPPEREKLFATISRHGLTPVLPGWLPPPVAQRRPWERREPPGCWWREAATMLAGEGGAPVTSRSMQRPG